METCQTIRSLGTHSGVLDPVLLEPLGREEAVTVAQPAGAVLLRTVEDQRVHLLQTNLSMPADSRTSTTLQLKL
jgi:hypothetical protein